MLNEDYWNLVLLNIFQYINKNIKIGEYEEYKIDISPLDRIEVRLGNYAGGADIFIEYNKLNAWYNFNSNGVRLKQCDIPCMDFVKKSLGRIALLVLGEERKDAE